MHASSLHASSTTSDAFPVALACGFTPLHLSTFLAAHLQQRLENRHVEMTTGLYGDLAGTLETLQSTSANAVSVAMEWSDLDPRLGFRSTGRWGATVVAAILSQVPRALSRIANLLSALPQAMPVALSTPSLPLPPLFHTPGWQASAAEAELDAMVARFVSQLQQRMPVRVVSTRRLAEESAPGKRFDLKSDLLTGLPYTLSHADALASAFARLIIPAAPKKGLITDLDETLWSGLAGEAGPEGVAWDLESHKAQHGLYQRLLATLAEEGVLIAVASKNDASVVERTFQREDILLPRESVFPFEVHWNAKSGSIARILQRWNISADSVVFVDDSPMELAEVRAAFPSIECIQFGGYEMLRRLRDLFGKCRLSEEDAFRSISIRSSSELAEVSGQGASEDFLKELDAVISFDFPDASPDARALELVNKTNQFNLNGIRYSEAEWSRHLVSKDSVFAIASYQDKFGPLGRISVLQGKRQGRSLRLDVWVLSCRAFARRIEWQCLRMLFERYDVDVIEFSILQTPRNGPMIDFLNGVGATDGLLKLDLFNQHRPSLYHTVKEAESVKTNG